MTPGTFTLGPRTYTHSQGAGLHAVGYLLYLPFDCLAWYGSDDDRVASL